MTHPIHDLRNSLMSARGQLVTGPEILASVLGDGMTLGIGGFGLDRKPMALVRAIAASGVRGLTVETYAGGLDIEVLVAAGALACLSTCHVGLDHFGLAPLFRAARESGRVAFKEWSEWTQLVAWRAAAEGVPFATARLDPDSQLPTVNPDIVPLASPFDNGRTFAIRPPVVDVAILHAEAAHPRGWAIAEGDPYLDASLARAARTVVLSTERLMDDAELEARHRDVHLVANTVDAVVLAPGGALPGSCLPSYMIDFPALRGYVEGAAAGTAPAVLVDGLFAGLLPAGS